MDKKMQQALLEKVANLTSEEFEDIITSWKQSQHGGQDGYDWAMAREAERQNENVPKGVPAKMRTLLSRVENANAQVALANAEMQDAHEALMQYGEERVGLKRRQKLKVRVRQDSEEGGYIYDFKFLDNGVVLFGFAYGWGATGYFNLSDIVEVWEGDFVSEDY